VLIREIWDVAGDQYNKDIGVRARRVDLRYYMVRMKKGTNGGYYLRIDEPAERG